MAGRDGSATGLDEYRRKRDFHTTAEPAGRKRARRKRRATLRFVIQKHAATNLHFDLRLELDGVMKSWAVPKGPSMDPADKRLAMEVEDHPIEYNDFEGTIPKGEYGGGTVMIWDRGTYHADEAEPGRDEEVLHREYREGKLSITFDGERLSGSFTLVRTDSGPKPKWLLIKHRDEHVRRGSDIVAEHETSIVTGRTMAEIAAEEEPGTFEDVAIAPMMPKTKRELPEGEGWIHHLAGGGERAVAYVTAESARLIARGGKDRTDRYAAIAEALRAFAGRTAGAFVIDGEINGEGADARYLVFDLLLDGDGALLDSPLEDRLERLGVLFRRRRIPGVRVAPSGRAATLLRRAAREGGDGVLARRADSPYRPGRRTDEWRLVRT